MTLIAWNGGPIFHNGAVGTEQACCCGGPPPCESCLECDWPYKWPTFLFASGDTIECDDFFPATAVVYQDIFPYEKFVTPLFELQTGISWKEGYPEALSDCGDYVWVQDRALLACCYTCGAEGNTYEQAAIVGEKQRHRILRLSCPDGPESVIIQDVTADALDGNTEPEFEYVNQPPEGCGEKTCLPYMPFFPDPEPVCNEFP